MKLTYVLLACLLYYTGLSALTLEQTYRIQQGVCSLNVKQVKTVLNAINNKLTQEEYQQLMAILNDMPERDYYAKAAEATSDFVSYSMSTLAFGSLALTFCFLQRPYHESAIQSQLEVATHNIPRGLAWIFCITAAGSYAEAVGSLIKNIKFSLAGKRYYEIVKLLSQACVQAT